MTAADPVAEARACLLAEEARELDEIAKAKQALADVAAARARRLRGETSPAPGA